MTEVRCQTCRLLLCRVSEDFTGAVEVKCRKCGTEGEFTPAKLRVTADEFKTHPQSADFHVPLPLPCNSFGPS